MRNRRYVIGGTLGVVVAGCFVGWYVYLKYASDAELQDAIAEADRLDPGWRLEELEAKRAVIPAAENSAEQILAIKGLLPTSWMPESLTKPPKPEGVPINEEASVSLEQTIFELPPEVQMSPEQTRELRAALEIGKEFLAQARALGHYRIGRHHITWSLPFNSPPSFDLPSAVSNLLWYDARVRAQDGDIEGALTSVLCILSVARSYGDEPGEISQIYRRAQSWVATQALERILAQGQAPSNCLANVQRAFEDEESQPLFLIGVRGERAEHHRIMEAIETGKLKASAVYGTLAGPVETWLEDVAGEAMYRRAHGPWIRVMNQVVEIAKLPVEEQRSRLNSYLHSVNENPDIPVQVRLLMPGVGRFAEGSWRHQTTLRCAIVALAVERFRISHGHWPDSLTSLVPEYLGKVPLDPFDGKPLRYRLLKDGVIIYSVGPDETDDGGNLDRENPIKPGTDLGFQLWDVNSRRQPWRPPAKKTVPPDDD